MPQNDAPPKLRYVVISGREDLEAALKATLMLGPMPGELVAAAAPTDPMRSDELRLRYLGEVPASSERGKRLMRLADDQMLRDRSSELYRG